MPSTFVAKTSQQTLAPSAGGLLTKILSYVGKRNVTYLLLKEIALHPIVRLGTELIIGIIAKSPWNVVIDENSPHYALFTEEELESIRLTTQNNLDEFRDEILNTALRNQIIYGWQAFERVIEWNPEKECFVVKELKPILQDFTYILTDKAGNYAGIRNIPPTDGKIVDIPASEVILFNVDVQGQNWYGTPLLLSAVEPYLRLCKLGAYKDKYLDRISSVSAVLKFPIGKETMPDGSEVDNYEIAQSLAKGLAENSVVAIPNTLKRELATDESPGWEIDFVDPHNSAIGGIFEEQVKHEESLLINALGLPSRVVLDGQYGSYSSNQTYRDASYDILQTRLNRLIKTINQQFIDPMLNLNYNAPGLLHIKAAPLDDDSIQNMFRLYSTLKDDPNVDQVAVLERLGIPETDTSDKFESIGEVPEQQPQLDGHWFTVAELSKKLTMSPGSIRSQMKRYKALDPDFAGIWRGSDNRLRLNENFAKEVFGIDVRHIEEE